MTVMVRLAEERDVPSMAAIRAREWQTQEFWERRIGGYLRGEHSPQQALMPRAVFVAVEGAAIVGFVAGHRTLRYGCDAELQWIDVVTERRREGIAGTLMETMAGWFVEQAALRVCVNVDPKNAVARGLYAKYGARDINPHWMVWDDARRIGLS